MLHLLAAPLLVRLVADDRAGLALAAALGTWLAVQAGLHLAPASWLERRVEVNSAEVVLRSAFNPLAWQLAFSGGVILGALIEGGKLDPARLLRPRAGSAAAGAEPPGRVRGPAALARLRPPRRRRGRAAGLGRAPPGPGAATDVELPGAGLSHGLAGAAAPGVPDSRVRRVGRGLRALLDHPWLVTLGRRSLPVFCFHVLLVYALRYVDSRLGGIPDPWFSLVTLGAIASLFATAALLEARGSAAHAAAARGVAPAA
jgi:hypothetical protein